MKTFHAIFSLKRCSLFHSKTVRKKTGRIKAAGKLCNLGEKREEQNQREKKNEEQKKFTPKRRAKHIH